MAHVEIRRGEIVTRFALDEAASSIGRHPDNTITVNDPDMSRRHCIIERQGKKFHVLDMGSRNGTKLNSMRVVREPLKHGDVIQIGATEIRFIDEAAVAASPNATRRAVVWGGIGAGFAAGVVLTAWLTGTLERYLQTGIGDDSRETGSSIVSADRGAVGPPAAPDVAPPGAAEYALVTAETLESMSQTHLNKPVWAVFLGSPTPAADGSLHWELPPDGELVAVIDPGSTAYDLLSAEQGLLEVKAFGVLQARSNGPGVCLRVGEMMILRPWAGKVEDLAPRTQAVLGKRLIVNRAFATATSNSNSG